MTQAIPVYSRAPASPPIPGLERSLELNEFQAILLLAPSHQARCTPLEAQKQSGNRFELPGICSRGCWHLTLRSRCRFRASEK